MLRAYGKLVACCETVRWSNNRCLKPGVKVCDCGTNGGGAGEINTNIDFGLIGAVTTYLLLCFPTIL